MSGQELPKPETFHFYHSWLSGKMLGPLIQHWPEAEVLDFRDVASVKTVRSLRRQVSSLLPPLKEAISVYHDGWGIDLFADLDTAPHRVVYLHALYPFWERHLAHAIRFASALAVPSEAMFRVICDRFPWIPARFIQVWPLPVVPRQDTAAKDSTPVIGTWLRAGFKDWNRLRSVADFLSGNHSHLGLEVYYEGTGMPKSLAHLRVPYERVVHWRHAFQLQDWVPWSPERLSLSTQNIPVLLPKGDIFEKMELPNDLAYEYGDWEDLGRRLVEVTESDQSLKSGLSNHRKVDAILAYQKGLEALRQRRTLSINRRAPKRSWRPLSWYHLMFTYRIRGQFRY